MAFTLTEQAGVLLTSALALTGLQLLGSNAPATGVNSARVVAMVFIFQVVHVSRICAPALMALRLMVRAAPLITRTSVHLATQDSTLMARTVAL